MNKIARSLLVIGLSGWFLAGCVGTDIDDVGENDEALVLVEDAHQEQEAFSDGDEELSDAELEGDRDYSTEVCSGFSGYGSACQVKCSNGAWYTVGYYPWIGEGQCTSAGHNWCYSQGLSHGIGHCWN